MGFKKLYSWEKKSQKWNEGQEVTSEIKSGMLIDCFADSFS